MTLHEDNEIFEQCLLATTDFMVLPDMGIAEKDYFVTYLLQKIAEKQPNVVFKGGSSLSKCHKAISRFSEDIDLNVNAEKAKLTEGQRKQLKQDIVEIISESGFTLENPDQIRSRRDFNRYMISYETGRPNSFLAPHVIVETSVFIKSFPSETMQVSSLVHDFLLATGSEGEIIKYGLEPFKVNVQSIERTFIDKVFALADYYLDGNVENHSRHIYDLYKLYQRIDCNDSFIDLVKDVRKVRKPNRTCYSAQDGVNLPELLRKILSDDIYKSDYNRITTTLLFEDLPYSEAITVIHMVLTDGCFE